ncbi:MAG: hypothetical protein IJP44_10540 [Bacteroidales bacterium]|nr:hypothetical protein [Bacteroidales bacterium]
MDANSEYFEKFIIKQIVSKIDFNPDSGSYSFNEIHISDEILKIIDDEGLRYGMQSQQVRQFVSRVAENVRTEPYIEIRNNGVSVKELKEGQHLRINFTHPVKGKLYVELMTIAPACFFVLDSDIPGICFGDEFHSQDKMWNNYYSIGFKVFRKSKRIPDVDTTLLLWNINSIELFRPSVIHEILDSKDSYSFESNYYTDLNGSESHLNMTLGSEEELLEATKKYNIWQPSKLGEDAIVFDWKEGDTQQEDSTFIILDDDIQRKAKIMFNPLFTLPTETFLSEGIIKIIQSCCKARNEFTGLSGLKYIKPMKEGILKRIKDDNSSKEWVLEKKPQVKFVYGK